MSVSMVAAAWPFHRAALANLRHRSGVSVAVQSAGKRLYPLANHNSG
jgi:hypothetical protein